MLLQYFYRSNYGINKKTKQRQLFHLSIFAGRIADAGVDPEPIFNEAKALLVIFQRSELLWASPENF